MRRLRIRFVYLLIAALLLAQQGLALHGLGHGVEALKLAKQGQVDPRGLPNDRQCDLCLTYAQVAAGAPAAVVAIVDVPRTDAAPLFSVVFIGLAGSRAYRSRAPPRLA